MLRRVFLKVAGAVVGSFMLPSEDVLPPPPADVAPPIPATLPVEPVTPMLQFEDAAGRVLAQTPVKFEPGEGLEVNVKQIGDCPVTTTGTVEYFRIRGRDGESLCRFPIDMCGDFQISEAHVDTADRIRRGR